VIPTLQESAAEMIGSVICPSDDDLPVLERRETGSSGSSVASSTTWSRRPASRPPELVRVRKHDGAPSVGADLSEELDRGA
jgi:hypothetical protein